jgi:predicted helicase
MSAFKLKPTHAPVKAYYETLAKCARGKFDNESNVRRAFEALLEKCARPFEWIVMPEYPITRSGKNPLKVDAAILDAFNLPRGYWEAKDEKDDLKAEMNKKFAAGYPRTNILFQKPTHAILFQDGHIAYDGDITESENLVEVLRLFFEWRQPHQEDWDRAVREFSERIPEIARGAMVLIEAERKSNPAFVERFTAFAELCRESINPDLKDEAVEEMLVQHLLTERIFRRIFDNPEFTRRNVIAAEIEKVIDSLTKRHFSRDAFLRDLDPFYKAIEETAANASDYSEKQAFLNKVYEKFFQGFNPKQADTHGIVYTPQPIVNFMVRSVEEVLKTEFDHSLSDKGVHILDPFVGTGTFITRVMKEIKKIRIQQKYKEELHCNEIMLLPYYIASMNIEHTYLDMVGEYEPFEGICLVDTFENSGQDSFFTTENTKRIRRQMAAPIRVVIGNPPYNMGQQNENDQNKNRRYARKGGVDERVAKTYTRDSMATLRNKLSDPYVKAFRWATDRIQDHGVVCFVSNNSFVDQIAFDGMRTHLERDFSKIYVIDLGGNVRKNPKLSGTTHNVFGIQVGVAITILVRHVGNDTNKPAEIFYARMGEDWRKELKYRQLEEWQEVSNVTYKRLEPDARHTWFTEGQQEGFRSLLPLGIKGTKSDENSDSIFSLFSLGVASNRDAYNYNASEVQLKRTIKNAVSAYNETLAKYKAIAPPRPEADAFVDTEDKRLKWTRQTKATLANLKKANVEDEYFRESLYRPFHKLYFYFADFWNEERYQQNHIFPQAASTNRYISLNSSPGDSGFYCLAADKVADLHLTGDSQCFPFYAYNEDGTNRRENITDWALAEFRSHYGEKKISKWDIFHYTYGLLHHPEYRTRYAANLKRELPRIPMAPEFRRFAEIGSQLMKLHIEYEKQKEYLLERRETEGVKLNWRVEKMTLSKDKTQLKYNEFLTLSGIPPEVYEYRLGNRSALEWVVDQYRVSTDARSGIENDPNRDDDPEYIVRLIGQVVAVSIETVRLVKELAGLSIDQ